MIYPLLPKRYWYNDTVVLRFWSETNNKSTWKFITKGLHLTSWKATILYNLNEKLGPPQPYFVMEKSLAHFGFSTSSSRPGWFYFLFYSDQDCGLHAVTLSWSKFGIWRSLRKTGELWETPLEQGKNQQQTQPKYATELKSNLGYVGGRRTLSPQSTAVLGLQQQLTAAPSLKLMIT